MGPSEILAALGAGGMGEVYRATDTKLKRQVGLRAGHSRPTSRGSGNRILPGKK